MRRSMFSLILADDVVREVDKLAGREGTSRSALINRVLADYFNLLTPEKQVEEIYKNVSEHLKDSETLRILNNDSGIFSVRGTLDFKYNPIIRYDVMVHFGTGGYSGELRVVSRSQSPQLISKLNVFFEIWSQIEQSCVEDRAALSVLLHSQISAGRFQRNIVVQTDGKLRDCEGLGKAIGEYINLFNQALKLYFAAPPSGVTMETYKNMLSLYQNYLSQCEFII